MIGNENNFGSMNTAGGYGKDGTCFDIFQEAKDAGCLEGGASTTECNGSCKEFTSSVCALYGDTGVNLATLCGELDSLKKGDASLEEIEEVEALIVKLREERRNAMMQ